MIPLLTAEQMRAADARAVRRHGQDALVTAAGTAVALEAKRMLGSLYGRRVCVLCGPGLNGGDGRVAARWLRGRGAKVTEVEVANQPSSLEGFDLIIDAAFGLGCSRPYVAPTVSPRTTVLAVDLPSGVDADSGQILGAPLRADVTLALGALKYAHVDGPSRALVGTLRFAGLDIVESFNDALVEDADLSSLVRTSPTDHKWSHALQVFAGSSLMAGAAELVTRGALAGGASMIRLATRDADVRALIAPEVVLSSDASTDARCRAVVAGPGLGAGASEWLRERVRGVDVPVVLDADGLHLELIAAKRPTSSWILTPHEGEFARLGGDVTSSSRVAAVRELARATGCTVLLKGPVTLIASATGTLRVVTSGNATLATAGTGDVLAGLIGATIARGHDVLDAAALSAHVHGLAGASLESYARASELAPVIRTMLKRLESESVVTRE